MIGHDVWLGHGVMIVGGVKIGNGAVIGAGSVVAKNIPPYAIAVGNPARVIRYRLDADTIRKLQLIKWWNWDIKKINEYRDLMYGDARLFANKFYSPDLESRPHDKLGDDLRDLKSKGHRVFATILDFDSPNPLWKKIIHDFSECSLKDVVLVLHAPKNLSNAAIQSRLNNEIHPLERKWIFATRFSTDALLETDILVTTREFDSMTAFDMLYSKSIDIRYALDDLVFY